MRRLHLQENDDAVADPLEVRQLQRLKVYQTLVKMDTMFKDIGVNGLLSFRAPEDDRSLLELPFFVYCPDQDSAGHSAYFAMTNHYNISVWPMFDPMHRVHNDINLGISNAGLKPVVLLCTILFNLSWGPWASCGWFEKIKEEAAAYWATSGPEDPIFQHLLHRIKVHSSDWSEAMDLESDDATCSSLCESSFLLRKGPKVLLSRWASWLKCMREWAPQWHKRLLLLLVYGISHGYCKRGAHALSLNGALSITKEDGKENTMKAQKDDIRALRDKASNTMVLALHLHNEESLFGCAMMISRASAPLRAGAHEVAQRAQVQRCRLQVQHGRDQWPGDDADDRSGVRLLQRRGVFGASRLRCGAVVANELVLARRCGQCRSAVGAELGQQVGQVVHVLGPAALLVTGATHVWLAGHVLALCA